MIYLVCRTCKTQAEPNYNVLQVFSKAQCVMVKKIIIWKNILHKQKQVKTLFHDTLFSDAGQLRLDNV